MSNTASAGLFRKSLALVTLLIIEVISSSACSARMVSEQQRQRLSVPRFTSRPAVTFKVGEAGDYKISASGLAS